MSQHYTTFSGWQIWNWPFLPPLSCNLAYLLLRHKPFSQNLAADHACSWKTLFQTQSEVPRPIFSYFCIFLHFEEYFGISNLHWCTCPFGLQDLRGVTDFMFHPGLVVRSGPCPQGAMISTTQLKCCSVAAALTLLLDKKDKSYFCSFNVSFLGAWFTPLFLF